MDEKDKKRRRKGFHWPPQYLSLRPLTETWRISDNH